MVMVVSSPRFLQVGKAYDIDHLRLLRFVESQFQRVIDAVDYRKNRCDVRGEKESVGLMAGAEVL